MYIVVLYTGVSTQTAPRKATSRSRAKVAIPYPHFTSLPNAPEPGYNCFPGQVGGNLLEGYSEAGRVGDTLFVVFELNLEAVDKLWRE